MTFSQIMLYLFVISISTGFIFNTVGDKALLALFVLLVLSHGKIKLKKNLILGMLPFLLFYTGKCLGVNVARSSEYHSLYAEVSGVISVAIMLFFLNCLLQTERDWSFNTLRNAIRLFNLLYYFTLIITIVALLRYGVGFYRNNSVEIKPVYAPQFFLIYAIVLGYVLTYKLFTEGKGRSINVMKLCLNGVFVLLMNYTTQIGFFVMALILAFLVVHGRTIAERVIIVVIVFVLVISILPMMSDILMYFNNHFFTGNEDLSMRLVELSNFFATGDLSGEAFGGRFQVMYMSIKTFFEHPFAGISFRQYNTGIVKSIGGHHEWADDIAKYGILGMTFYIIMLVCGLKELKISTLKRFDIGVPIYVLLILFGFFDPIVSMNTLIALMIGYVGVTVEDRISLKSMCGEGVSGYGYIQKNQKSIYKTF